MNSMDDRWNNCARAARSAPPETPPPAPFGMALRAMRGARASAMNDTLDQWALLLRRTLALTAMAVTLAASLLWWQEANDSIPSPALADEAIQQVLWHP